MGGRVLRRVLGRRSKKGLWRRRLRAFSRVRPPWHVPYLRLPLIVVLGRIGSSVRNGEVEGLDGLCLLAKGNRIPCVRGAVLKGGQSTKKCTHPNTPPKNAPKCSEMFRSLSCGSKHFPQKFSPNFHKISLQETKTNSPMGFFRRSGRNLSWRFWALEPLQKSGKQFSWHLSVMICFRVANAACTNRLLGVPSSAFPC